MIVLQVPLEAKLGHQLLSTPGLCTLEGVVVLVVRTVIQDRVTKKCHIAANDGRCMSPDPVVLLLMEK